MRALKSLLVSCFVALLLGACGGGGSADYATSTSPPTTHSSITLTPPPSFSGRVTSTLDFPFKSALSDSVKAGESANFTISGDCSGTASLTTTKPITASFEGASALSVTNTTSISLSNCSPYSLYSTTFDYFDANYVPLGTTFSSGDYGVFLVPPVIPDMVKVGDTGVIGKKNFYANSSKTLSSGYDELSYVIEPDTENSVIVNLINKSFDQNEVFYYAEQNRYRIWADGTMIPVSADAQNGGLHLIMTASPDTVQPTVVSYFPTNTATVSTSTAITATFSEHVDASTMNTSTFTLAYLGVDDTSFMGTFTLLYATGEPISGSVSLNGRTATFTPNAPLPYSGVYRVTISSDIKDLSGNSAIRTTWTFKTDYIAPNVVATTPANLATGVTVNSGITATFSEALDSTTITDATFSLTDGTNLIPGVVGYTNTTATFTPSVSLSRGVTYTAIIGPGVKDVVGNPMTTSYSWSFAFDSFAPSVLTVSPANLATEISATTPIVATLSEAMDSATINSANYFVTDGTNPVSGTVSYVNGAATFTPTVPLTNGTSYTATITTGVKDLSGNAMVTDYSWTFTTFALNPSPQPPLSQSVAYQIDYAHSGYASFGTPLAFPANPTWSVSLNGTISYPLIASGKVFVSVAGTVFGNGTQLYALDQKTGGVVWGPVSISGYYLMSGLAYDHARVFVLNYEGNLQAFNADTGQLVWSSKLPGYSYAAPPTAKNGVVYASGNGLLSSVSETSGKLLWVGTVWGDKSSPTVTDDGVFVTYPCQAYKFNPYSGVPLWNYSGGCTGGGGKTSPYVNGSLYMRDPVNLSLILDGSTGIKTDTIAGSMGLPIPAFSPQSSFYLKSGSLNAYDLSGKNLIWSFTGDGQLVSAPIVIDQAVIVGSSSGYVFALDIVTGVQIWSGNAGAPIAAAFNEYEPQQYTGLGAGEGYLVVPAGNVLTAWKITGQ